MTGTDRMKTSIVLDTMVTMFSEYCSQPFIIEPVIIEHSDGKTEQTPELKYWEQKVFFSLRKLYFYIFQG